MRLYTVEELEEMETVSQTQGLDLKVDEGGFRVWLDRTGEDVPVQYEVNVGGSWFDAVPDEDETVLVVNIHL